MVTPRTLADQLRGWSEEQLVALLRARPDLAVPAPQDSAQLAARAGVRASVLRCLDDLDALQLAVLRALVQGADPAQVVRAAASSRVTATARLRALALVWGPDDQPVSIVGDLLRQPPGPTEPDLDDLSEEQRGVLERLDRTGADGLLERGSGPGHELLERGLLARRDERHVSLPWSVRLALHGGHTSDQVLDEPPPLQLTDRGTKLVDRAAAGTAHELVRRTELLLERWGTAPPSALRAGGVGVRDMRAAASLLHVELAEASLIVETAHAAGLLGRGMTDDADDAWMPTDAFDAWLDRPVEERWLLLARAWYAGERQVSLVGGRLGDKPVNALAPDLERTWVAALRAELLHVLAGTPEGAVLAGEAGWASLRERLRWDRPRRPGMRLDEVAPLLQEAAALGVVALDGLSALGRVLLGEDRPLAPLFPQPVDHVLLQADLTAIAPGPLEPDLARRLALLADVESQGGATVYRFAASSVRRAFDAGWSAAEVHDFVGSVSRTPVPQSVSYLVDDVARRFGTLRAGHAESFLRSDDEAALAGLLHEPGAASLRLRRIAPTVVISDVPLGTLLPRLRELGLAPVVEAEDGTVRVARPDVFRARRARRSAPARAPLRFEAVATAVRAGDRVAASRPTGASATTPADVLTLLRTSAEARVPLRIGYVDNHGTRRERVVRPLAVEGGQLVAHDERDDDVRRFAVHRISVAQTIAGSGPNPG